MQAGRAAPSLEQILTTPSQSTVLTISTHLQGFLVLHHTEFHDCHTQSLPQILSKTSKAHLLHYCETLQCTFQTFQKSEYILVSTRNGISELFLAVAYRKRDRLKLLCSVFLNCLVVSRAFSLSQESLFPKRVRDNSDEYTKGISRQVSTVSLFCHDIFSDRFEVGIAFWFEMQLLNHI